MAHLPGGRRAAGATLVVAALLRIASAAPDAAPTGADATTAAAPRAATPSADPGEPATTDAALATTPDATVDATADAIGARPRRHAIYVELFGKGGLWGLGYQYALSRHFAAGAVGSFYVLGGDRYLTLSPYVTAYPLWLGHHRWFVELGPQVVRRATPSPVPEWQGMSTTALGGEVSTGWEYRAHLLVRVYAMAEIGDRLTPWFGASVGWTL